MKGLCGGYVEDILQACDSSFRTNCDKSRENFDMPEDQSLSWASTGFSLSTGSEKLDHTRPAPLLAQLRETNEKLLILRVPINKDETGLAINH